MGLGLRSDEVGEQEGFVGMFLEAIAMLKARFWFFLDIVLCIVKLLVLNWAIELHEHGLEEWS